MKEKVARGFTFVEMTIVIAIIAILAAIAVPNLLVWVCNSRSAEGSASIQIIGTALRLYNARNSTFLPPATTTWPTLNVQMQPGRRYTLCIALASGTLRLAGDIPLVIAGCPGAPFTPAATQNTFRASGHANIDRDTTTDIVWTSEALEPRHGILPGGALANEQSDCM